MVAGLLCSRALLKPLHVWMFVAAVALALRLGAPPLLDPDEGRNAEVAREMATSNNYVLPHLNGLPYIDKPVVYFAAEAAFMEILGPTELAARLPAYLFTLATAAVLFGFVRRLWGGEEAAVAVIAFLSMPLTVAFARTVIFDSALTFFMVVSIVAFYQAVETRHRRWATLAWGSIAIGVLTKGPVALLLPLMVGIPYAIWRRAFGKLFSWGGLILFVGIIAPWVWAVSLSVPDFLEYVLVTETAQRLATEELKRTGPPWYFIPYLAAGALPWSIVAIASWRELRRRDPVVIFLLLWIAVPLIFFSLSQSKRPQYILPLMPPIALLIASAWQSVRMRAAAIAMAVFGAILLIAPLVPNLTRKMQPVLVQPVKLTAYSLGGVILAGGIAAALLRRREHALIALSMPLLALPLITVPLLEALAERRSTKSFVARLGTHVRNAEVIGVEAFTGSLAFYLGRPIVVASLDATEFTSNYLMRRYHRFAGTRTLRTLDWYRRDLDECCRPRVYIVRNDDRTNRALFESSGIPLIATGAHHVAYGPYRGHREVR
jgi:4-amino-4-deoxy-L-arabinose transferase-like glycosyltransferase